MDIKISGLSREILHEALEQAHKGRMHIMGIMLDTVLLNLVNKCPNTLHASLQ